MKTKIYAVVTAIALLFSVNSCKDETIIVYPKAFSGKLISHTECKVMPNDSAANLIESLSCAEYSFNGTTNKLLIKHINAGFNCCPDSIFGNVSISNDTIIIQEFESNPQCYCLCLYDLDFEIEGIEAKKYQLKFIEPLLRDQQPLIFGIDLSAQPEGSWCATRHLNPWGMGNSFSINGK